jgi:hypothetical protein
MEELTRIFNSRGNNAMTEQDQPPEAKQLARFFPDGTVVPSSLQWLDECLLGIVDFPSQEKFFAIGPSESLVAGFTGFEAKLKNLDDYSLLTTAADVSSSKSLRTLLPHLNPRPLGLQSSFGFGDRLGLATPGHAAAMHQFGQGMVPVFCQQSIREMIRTDRSPDEVMSTATWGAFRAGWQQAVGADADHLKTFEDLENTAKAGFCFFTIDPSDHVDQKADNYGEIEVENKFQALLEDAIPGAESFISLYAGKSFDLEGAKGALNFETGQLKRAAVKYGRALAHITAMTRHSEALMGNSGFDLEISVDETEQPTSVHEHLFLALELKRNQIPVTSLAPRFIGDFEKGIDFRGDLNVFVAALKIHAAIASQYGPYKISLHSGSDKFSVYPPIAETCDSNFHVKTAGTSYLEALRVVCRVAPELFRDIVSFCRDRFPVDRATYHISASLEGTPPAESLSPEQLEQLYLTEDNGRQLLHVTFGSVLTVCDGEKFRFKDDLLSMLKSESGLHESFLIKHFGKHLSLLQR